jgi:hypothetical protein
MRTPTRGSKKLLAPSAGDFSSCIVHTLKRIEHFGLQLQRDKSFRALGLAVVANLRGDRFREDGRWWIDKPSPIQAGEQAWDAIVIFWEYKDRTIV